MGWLYIILAIMAILFAYLIVEKVISLLSPKNRV